MSHDTPFIAIMSLGLSLAFIFGLMAKQLRLPMIAGYLLAGVVLGPFTPGYVADQHLASEMAEMGVIFLMFGVGLHFSLADLMRVRGAAVPGALGQIVVATAAGVVLAYCMGWDWGAGLVFGLALSVASTVVLLRTVEARGEMQSDAGKLAVGWLIVEDLLMVVVLVLIPPLAGVLGGNDPSASLVVHIGGGSLGATLFLTLVKVAGFVVLMLGVGPRLVPKLLAYCAGTGDGELFRLAVLAVALGVAYAAALLFGVSFALGAFFAGMVMANAPQSAKAMEDTLPLRDAFAVLFFVSVGMLFDPAVVVDHPLALLATVAIIIGVKAATAYGLTRMLGHDRDAARMIAASLAQIGEFSFMLGTMGVAMAILPTEARSLIVAGAMISILLNPLVFLAADRWR